MSLIIAIGSNIGDPLENLKHALETLEETYHLIAKSRIYRSKAVDYEDQPDFFNQVLEFEIPHSSPEKVMKHLLEIEQSLGRVRNKWRGPRTIDIDIIFWANQTLQSTDLVLPHPRWSERSFVVRPLQELPFFQSVEKWFTIPESFTVEAFPNE
jgi:2-amino-4-hydroxy-6-hydroxymethyldihydropteridine diphosphokinase